MASLPPHSVSLEDYGPQKHENNTQFGNGENRGPQVGANYGTLNFKPTIVERAETPPLPSASIPFLPDREFVNRGDFLARVERISSEHPYRVALVGLGGVGKSQLAIKHAHRIKEGSPGTWVFWVRASTRAWVEQGFRSIADKVKLADREQPKANILDLVCKWLSDERNGKWVMVLDSADDSDVFTRKIHGEYGGHSLETFLPQSNNGSIIITTRDHALAERLTGDRDRTIKVGPMTETEALKLLSGKLGSRPDWNSVIATKLVHALDLFPLAISQAAAYIKGTARSSLEKYLEKFEKSEGGRALLLNHEGGNLGRVGSESNAIFTTWRISFEHIWCKEPSAAALLSLMSFFDSFRIPEWVLNLKGNGIVGYAAPELLSALDPAMSQNRQFWSEMKAHTDDMKPPSGNIALGDESDGSESEDVDIQFDRDVKTLNDYCLITVDQQGDEFEMHALVQWSTRKWLMERQQDPFKQQYIKRMAAAFPGGRHQDWATCQSLFSHVQVAIEYKKPKPSWVEDWATLMHNGAKYASSQGRYDIAEKMGQKASAARENHLGKGALETLRSNLLLGTVIYYRGRWDEAEKLQVQVMEACKTKFGNDHPDTLNCMNNLSLTYQEQCCLDKAERLQIQAMEACKRKFGSDHLDTLNCMTNLSLTYREQGRLGEAETLQAEVIEARKRKFEPNHPDTLYCIGILSSTYRVHGRLDEAEKLQVEAIEAMKKKLGADHPGILNYISNLALTYLEQGRLDEAEKLQVQVLEDMKRNLGPDHPITLNCINNLASTYREQGRLEEAEKLHMQVIETDTSKLRAHDSDVLNYILNLGSTYLAQGRRDEAQELLVEVMEAMMEELGADHPTTLTSMHNLACIWRLQGRYNDAFDLMEECARGRLRVLGPTHPRTRSSLSYVKTWGKYHTPCNMVLILMTGVATTGVLWLFLWLIKV